MSEVKKREQDRARLSELYAAIEHARNEEIAIEAINIARYWLLKAENQAKQIQNLERRNEREGDCDTCAHYDDGWDSGFCDPCCSNHSNYKRAIGDCDTCRWEHGLATQCVGCDKNFSHYERYERAER